MKNAFIIWVTLFLAVSCSSSAPRERKPFMIVGKVEKPTPIYTHLNLGYGLGAVDMDKSVLGTRFSSSSATQLYPNLSTVLHTSFVSIGAGYKYVYSWNIHESRDDNGNVIEKESFRSESQMPHIFLSKILFCPSRGSCLGLTGNYYPYLKTSFSSFSSMNQITSQKYTGNGFEAGLILYVPYASASLKYQKLNYKRFKSEGFFLNGDFYILLF